MLRRSLLAFLNVAPFLPRAMAATPKPAVAAMAASTPMETENRSAIGRITLGRANPEHPLEWMRRYQRDVHSPAIVRCDGIYEYRHFSLDAVRADLWRGLRGIDVDCPEDERLTSLSNVRYLNEADLARFNTSPAPEVRKLLIEGDVDRIQQRATTYRANGVNSRTLIDKTGAAAPQGPPDRPSFAVLIRRRSEQDAFRGTVKTLAAKWAELPGVLRLRLSLMDPPDVQAEQKAGYPVKTHPPALHYHAWIDLVLQDEDAIRSLVAVAGAVDLQSHVKTLHGFPLAEVYTNVYGGRPTLVGLRGYAAYQAIREFEAKNQTDPRLLEWMYGPVAAGGPVD